MTKHLYRVHAKHTHIRCAGEFVAYPKPYVETYFAEAESNTEARVLIAEHIRLQGSELATVMSAITVE